MRDVVTASTRRPRDQCITADEPEAHLVRCLPEHGLVVVCTRVRKGQHHAAFRNRARERRSELRRGHRLLADNGELIEERDEGHDQKDH